MKNDELRILVVGSGGREHAMVWKLLQSEKVERVYAAPGNGGTDDFSLPEKRQSEDDDEEIPVCENVDLLGRDICDAETQDALVRYALKERIDLVVIGPEAPLAAGIADRFRAARLPVAGPGAKAAALESSKAYAKAFMDRYGVRTARSFTFTSAKEALAASARHFGSFASKEEPEPLVLKADGLAAGKGVVVALSQKEADETIKSFMEEGTLGGAGKTLVVEEFLDGREVSVLAAVCIPAAGEAGEGVIVPFVPARDHKRRFDNDEGPNTGGMGAIAPVPDFSEAAKRDFVEKILNPTLAGIKAEGFGYRGFLFFGLMVKNNRCHLLEYNVRLGDPETQAVLPLMESDFAELCMAIADGTLADWGVAEDARSAAPAEGGAAINASAKNNGRENAPPFIDFIKWKSGAVCAPVAVAGGYPGEYKKGAPIAFNETAFAKTGAALFVAGATRSPGGPAGSGLRTAGGRVLACSAYGADAEEARKKAYAALAAVNFDGMDYRRDIGQA